MAESNEAISLRIDSLSKSYGQSIIIDDLCLDCFAGEVILLLGANGSGKSTLLRILSGLARPDSGSALTAAGQILKPSAIAHFGHKLFLYGNLTVEENLTLYSSLKMIAHDPSHYITRWGLTPDRAKRINELSKGLQTRTSLCRAFLGLAQYVFLDEPTNALDEAGIDALFQSIEESRLAGSTVIIATHDLTRLSSIATRVVILHQGKINMDSRTLAGQSRALDNELLNDRIFVYYRTLNR